MNSAPTPFPAWTVVYNVVSPGSHWVGTGWEFFDDEPAAHARAEVLRASGHVVSVRRYFDGVDREHLGAAHRFWLDRDHGPARPLGGGRAA